MGPLPSASGRGARLVLVGVALLALLGVVAVATRSGFGHSSRAAPSPGLVDWAFSVFLVLFVLMIPVAAYAYLWSARNTEQPARRGFRSRVVTNLLTFLICLAGTALVWYLLHHRGALHFNTAGLSKARLKHGRNGATTSSGPSFRQPVLWVALGLGAVALACWLVAWHRRPVRAPREADTTLADEVIATIGDAIGDLEAEPDARRAVIAAYARMERLLARRGLGRAPSETALEYLRRVLLGLDARGEAVERLTSLFERAKFSRHEIDAEMKQDAVFALRTIRDDLSAAAAA